MEHNLLVYQLWRAKQPNLRLINGAQFKQDGVDKLVRLRVSDRQYSNT